LFSFGEITLIVLIALFVLGPERLPAVARSLGRYWRQFNKFLDTAKAELNQMIDVEDEENEQEDERLKLTHSMSKERKGEDQNQNQHR